MRLFHTSDWHLGQNLHGQERDFEHTCFLDWLLGQLGLHRPDVLLIAGDIFDTVNPPLKAQERLYDFIISAHEQNPALTIVMIAGNHDSGSRIELPAPLMRRLRTHALGRVLWLDDGQLDVERLLIPLPGADGEIAGWCLALPFLRPAEVTGAQLGDDYLRGIGQVHEWLIAAANAKRQPGQALVAISHAHMAGGSVSEDSERSLIIGNAEALPASLFDATVSYVALGHLHKPQRVNGEERIRYCGSPIPLSFSEIGYQHQILDVQLDGEILVSVESRLIPRSVNLQRLEAAPLADILKQLADLPDIDLLAETQRQPWLEVRVRLDEPQPDLRQQVENALQGKAVRLVRIAAEYAGSGGREDSQEDRLIELDQLTPQELFSRAWQESYGSEVDEQTLKDFAVLLQEVQQEGEQP
ncbi:MULTISPECIES: exonuclease SbcCD subunit D C-terminal domain-containing protein [unclassified Pseudomonas]|uniref:exonuclease SbcCD subunit D C-terminal domain-containing protein n=1 Tax=unclassified Pseudomonas TaxID=196821 RepID=UPI0015A2386E|nr:MULTISPECIES: exonuclease SbcCD subunit D C-terminal domain-containing protein [unclassified Pseudomonas]NVZ17129.1 exonuclease SbcCD subunit D C-terminal domain-containing protein [Pseudomonas sp. IPO3775]NVZ94817.1 exonuclease SbcCD subunit D C-terminal domain-containing protein [Pseudomonas sp. B6001]NWA75054.1 exonuclease SbcCD subunit D C-terminal domain-containing protein [Pseudomonas sp. C8002]NWB13358.1 exonuclease SbcCD subunit D C-terminal domain-containing protein [Pseudomonas sp.